MNLVGLCIKKARYQHKPLMTQLALSKRVGALGLPIDRAGVAKIESGFRKVFDFEILYFAAALDLSLEALWDERPFQILPGDQRIMILM